MSNTIMLDPTAELAPAERQILPRLDSLKDTTIGLLDISKNDNDIPCLKDISLNDTGFLLLKAAISASAITAYLPLDVSFIKCL